MSRSLLMHGVASLVFTALLILVSELALLSFREKTLGEILQYSFAVNFHSSLPTCWLILAACTAFDYWKKFREREMAAARLAAHLSAARPENAAQSPLPVQHAQLRFVTDVPGRWKGRRYDHEARRFLRMTIDGDTAPVTSIARETDSPEAIWRSKKFASRKDSPSSGRSILKLSH